MNTEYRNFLASELTNMLHGNKILGTIRDLGSKALETPIYGRRLQNLLTESSVFADASPTDYTEVLNSMHIPTTGVLRIRTSNGIPTIEEFSCWYDAFDGISPTDEYILLKK